MLPTIRRRLGFWILHRSRALTSMAAAPGVKTPATEAAPTIANEPARFAANDTERR